MTHQGQFPSVTLSFNLRPGVALGQAVDAISQAAFDLRMPGAVTGAFQGNAQAFQSSLSSTPALIIAALLPLVMTLGHVLEERSLLGSQEAIRALSRLTQTKARRFLPYGGIEEISAQALRIGDRIEVRAGDLVPQRRHGLHHRRIGAHRGSAGR